MSARSGFAHIILIAVLGSTIIVFGLVYIKSLQKTPYTNPNTIQTPNLTAIQPDVKKSEEATDLKIIENNQFKVTYPSNWIAEKNSSGITIKKQGIIDLKFYLHFAGDFNGAVDKITVNFAGKEIQALERDPKKFDPGTQEPNNYWGMFGSTNTKDSDATFYAQADGEPYGAPDESSREEMLTVLKNVQIK